MSSIKEINLPFPVITENGGDFIDAHFNVECSTELLDDGKTLKLNFAYDLKCPFYERLLAEDKVLLVANINQKTYRTGFPLKKKSKNISMNLLAPNHNIVIRTMIVAKADFEFDYEEGMNIVFKYFDDKFKVKKRQIMGYGSTLEIELPTNNKVGSIFTISKFKDPKDINSGRPYDISFDQEVIDIKVQPKIHEQFFNAIKTNYSMNKLIYSSVVYSAIQLAIISILTDFENYKNYKWAIAIENKIKNETGKELPKDEPINTQDILTYTHIVLGSLITDAFECFDRGDE